MTRLVRALIEELVGDEEALEALAERLAPHLAARLAPAQRESDAWLDAKDAAAYLGLTLAALYRHTAARTIPFEQDGPGCRCWFRRSEVDAWRRGEWQRQGLRSAA